LLITGRVRGSGAAKFTIKGRLAGKAVSFTRSVELAKAPSRPWVGRLWAQSRVQHLLEEISLGTKDAEMTNEVTELALAYNFVTPYTSFLAIPESELGNMKGTVEAARERKKKIMADNPDVAELDEGERDLRRARFSRADSDDDVSAAPRELGVAEEEDALVGTGSPLAASSEVRKRGCAGCSTGSSANAGLLLVIALLVLRRRRR
jgi:MYXO-CTERM domain-containing protein